MSDTTWRPEDGPLEDRASQQAQDPATQRLPLSSARQGSGRRFAPGHVIGDRYRIVTRLGAGGMGEVYRAEDTKLGQEVALKFLPLRLSRERSLLERLHAEVRIGRTVSHPNVCRLYDIGDDAGQYFIAMEYVSGENLAHLLKRIGRIPGDKALDIARSLCAGLAAAHARGILHRDLKPANVMLDAEGDVRIADFGLAVENAAATEEKGLLIGTPAYMAPEQLGGESATVQSDIYALGLVLYEIFTGRRAHEGKSVVEIRDDTGSSVTRPSAILEAIDPAVERVILRCLDPDPANRPASVREVILALPGGDPLAAALAAGETPSPQLVAAAGRQGSLAPRVAWSLLLAVVLLFAYVLWISERTDLQSRVEARNPAVMRELSRELLNTIGVRPQTPFASDGFIPQPLAADHHAKNGGWKTAPERAKDLSQFWYLEYPLESRPAVEGPVLYVSEQTPLPSGASMVRLDLSGRLVELRHAPDPATAVVSQTIDWQPLWDAARIDPSRLEPVTPLSYPPYTYDTRFAWTIKNGAAGESFRIEAATFRGRPVWWKAVQPWERDRPAPVSRFRFGGPLFEVLIGAMILVLFALALTLAWSNVRRGRGDLAGTVRLAAWIAILSFAAYVVSADHAASAAYETGLLARAFMVAAGLALLLSIFHLGVEPVIRRRWPQLLISWSRLLDRRFRDPLVGRDALIGVLLGLLHLAASLSMQGLIVDPDTFLRFHLPTGPRSVLGALLDSVAGGVFQGLISTMMLVLILLFVHQRRAAMAVYFIVSTAIFSAAYASSGAPLYAAIVTTSLLLIATITGGPLTVAVMQAIYVYGINHPLGASSSWQWPIAAVGVAYIFLIALYGFVTALGSNRAFHFTALEEEPAKV